MKSIATVAILAAVAAPALGNIYPTAPIGSTKWDGGETNTVRWDDDGKAPSLATLGDIDVALYTGGQTQQTFLQTLATVDATAGSVGVRIPTNAGPDGQFYFLRFRKAGSTDLTNDVYTTRFTLSGMTGTFNSTILAQISGIPASILSATASASASSASASISSVASGASRALSSASSAASSVSARVSASTPAQTGDAAQNKAVKLAGVVAAVAVGAFAFLA